MHLKFIQDRSAKVDPVRELDVLRTIFNNMNDLVACIDVATDTYDMISPSLSVFLGLEQNIPMNRLKITNLPIVKDIPDLRKLYETAFNQRLPRLIYEGTMQNAEGKTKHLEINANIIYENGTAKKIILCLRDVTERREMDIFVRESESIFREIINSMRDATILLDTDGRVTVWNPAAENMFGFTEKEMRGNNLLDILSPSDLRSEYKKLLYNFQHNKNYEKSGITIELMARKKDSFLLFPVEVSISSHGKDSTWKAYCTIRDITERKEKEEENSQLIREKEAAIKTTENTLRIKELVLAMISHDMLNPAAAIHRISEELLEKGERNQKEHEQIFFIHENSQFLINLLRDILDLSKINDEKYTLTKNEFSIYPMINSLLTSIIKPLADKKNVNLYLSCSKNIGNLMAEEYRIKQILMNLLSNAVKFTPAGADVNLVISTDIDTIIFEVTDSGAGMNKEKIDHIFEPFVQISDEKIKRDMGTGLGLSIVKKIVELHAGDITVTSIPGSGSSFYVKLPGYIPKNLASNKAAETIPAPETTSSSLRLENKRILIVEDNKTHQHLLQNYFIKFGCTSEQITITDSVSAAIGFLDQERFDLAIIDNELVDGTGTEVLEHLRSSETSLQNRNIPAIAQTAYQLEENELMRQGYNGYLFKGAYSKNDLITVIKKVLSVE